MENAMNTIPATLLDPHTGKALAQISILGEPIQTDRLIALSKCLQGFAIHSQHCDLRQAWFNARSLVLRSAQAQQLVRIVMYPSEGEGHGYYEIIQKPGENREQ
jgi:hypothetical protein